MQTLMYWISDRFPENKEKIRSSIIPIFAFPV
jgi:hypothetical protein